ncbi:MAG: hypothetical protein WDM84_04625 [Bauldia sp.]
MRSTPYIDARDRAGKPRRERREPGRDEDHDSLEHPARPSRLPMVLLLVLII